MHLKELFYEGDHLNQNRLTAGIGLFVLLILIVIGVVLLSRELDSRQTQVSWREPVPALGYCDSEQNTPCIVSFNLDSNGEMLVNILTEGSSFPAFYLKIRHSEGESIYPCQTLAGFSSSVYCIGKALAMGEELQFFIHAIDDNRLLAQGNFSIIGMALSTVQVFVSPTEGTPSPSTPGTASTTAGTVTITPTAPRGTPTRTPTRTPSYPNPSTLTPGYPNPKPKP
ncbi:MAG TPA: hypothetical protein VGK56_19025 [Anaerolineales bacterium]